VCGRNRRSRPGTISASRRHRRLASTRTARLSTVRAVARSARAWTRHTVPTKKDSVRHRARKPFGRDAINTLTACDVDLVAERNRPVGGETGGSRSAGSIEVHGDISATGAARLSRSLQPVNAPSAASNSLTRSENHTELDARPPKAPRGARRLPPQGAAGARSSQVRSTGGFWMPKSAEPANAGREGTSDPHHGPASESA